MQLGLLPTSPPFCPSSSWCVKEIAATIFELEYRDWDQVRGHGWGSKRMTAEHERGGFHHPIPVCLPRWSEELLVVVVERRCSHARASTDGSIK